MPADVRQGWAKDIATAFKADADFVKISAYVLASLLESGSYRAGMRSLIAAPKTTTPVSAPMYMLTAAERRICNSLASAGELLMSFYGGPVSSYNQCIQANTESTLHFAELAHALSVMTGLSLRAVAKRPLPFFIARRNMTSLRQWHSTQDTPAVSAAFRMPSVGMDVLHVQRTGQNCVQRYQTVGISEREFAAGEGSVALQRSQRG